MRTCHKCKQIYNPKYEGNDKLYLCGECDTKRQKTYNGWKNYETWSIALFIDNEEEWYHHVRMLIEANSKANETQYDLMQDIKAFIEDNLLTSNLTPYQEQCINTFISECDWKEVIEHYKEE